MVESSVNLAKALFGPQARMSPKRGWAEITRQGRPESTVPVRMDATVSSPLGEPSQPLQGHADQPAGPMTGGTGRLERKESDIIVAAALRLALVVWPGRGRSRVGPPNKWPMRILTWSHSGGNDGKAVPQSPWTIRYWHVV
ncbi:hypothetical protein ColLi_11980 [Colletotrichum liriopes]|uniref:Uncharacterized protein n=1 Tax=Colletotrichum liriopes TaxID=708192 RepID=A0AA37LY87_9PEZI|nr:hypothetical protein ColLi_11980 [Colletotrichum liriopes]